MILFINVLITHGNIGTYFRGCLPNYDKLDVFKYMLSSLSCIDSWTKIYINCKLDSGFDHRYLELEEHINKLFGQYEVYFKRDRCELQSEWQQSLQPILDDSDKIVAFFCNHDHIFLDSKLDLINKAIAELESNNAHPYRTLYTSHWPEMLSCSWVNEHKFYDEDFVSFHAPSPDSIQLVTKDVLRGWWFDHNYGNIRRGRTDSNGQVICPDMELLVPLREQFRHFDGYNARDILPALKIPHNFFTGKIRIRYGYNIADPEAININPSYPHCSDVDINGTEFRYTLDEIPLVLKLCNIDYDINPDYNMSRAKPDRDRAILSISQCKPSTTNETMDMNKILKCCNITELL